MPSKVATLQEARHRAVRSAGTLLACTLQRSEQLQFQQLRQGDVDYHQAGAAASLSPTAAVWLKCTGCLEALAAALARADHGDHAAALRIPLCLNF
jgi:hypothetical protein